MTAQRITILPQPLSSLVSLSIILFKCRDKTNSRKKVDTKWSSAFDTDSWQMLREKDRADQK